MKTRDAGIMITTMVLKIEIIIICLKKDSQIKYALIFGIMLSLLSVDVHIDRMLISALSGIPTHPLSYQKTSIHRQ